MNEMQRRLTSFFHIIVSMPATAMGFALSVQIAALSWIMANQYHLNIEEVGFVWAAGPLAGILGQVVIGFISDKVWFWGGRRRPFIIIGGLLAAVMLLALPNIADIQSALGISSLIIVALVVALSLDLAINISFNPTRSLIADVTPEGEPRTRGFTWMQTISGFFGVFAYVIGAVFGNYVLIYLGAGLVILFSIVPLFFITEPKVLSGTAPEASSSEPAVQPARTDWGELLKLYVAHGFSWIGIQTMFVFIFAFISAKITPTYGEDSSQIISISFAIMNSVAFILPTLVLAPLASKFGRVKTHLTAVGVMAVGYAGILFFGYSSIVLYILMVVLGIGWGSVVSLPFAVMSEKAQSNRMGFFMGIFNLSVVIPQLFVSLVIGGFIERAADKSIIFIISTVTLALSAALWLFVKEPGNKRSVEVPPAGH